MNWFSLCVALAAGVLSIGTADAKAGHGNHPSGSHPGGQQGGQGGHGHQGGHLSKDRKGHRKDHKDYHLTHGKKFSKGYYYPGRNHSHWSHKRYLKKYRRTCFYCPSVRCWYYWCGSRDCYLPVGCTESDLPDEGNSEADGSDTQTRRDSPVRRPGCAGCRPVRHSRTYK